MLSPIYWYQNKSREIGKKEYHHKTFIISFEGLVLQTLAIAFADFTVLEYQLSIPEKIKSVPCILWGYKGPKSLP